MTKSSKSARDNRANQLNPTNRAYYQSRYASPIKALREASHFKPAMHSRAIHACAASLGEQKAFTKSS